MTIAKTVNFQGPPWLASMLQNRCTRSDFKPSRVCSAIPSRCPLISIPMKLYSSTIIKQHIFTSPRTTLSFFDLAALFSKYSLPRSPSYCYVFAKCQLSTNNVVVTVGVVNENHGYEELLTMHTMADGQCLHMSQYALFRVVQTYLSVIIQRYGILFTE